MRYLKNNGILARCTDMYRDERFRPLGLNSRQSVLLLQVCRNSGVKQDALSKAIFIDKSNITRQMAALEEAGLVTRCPDEEDRRQVRVFPTEKALVLLPEIRAGFREWREYLQEGLTEEELEKGSMICPHCNEVLEFNYDEIEAEAAEEADAEGDDAADSSEPETF